MHGVLEGFLEIGRWAAGDGAGGERIVGFGIVIEEYARALLNGLENGVEETCVERDDEQGLSCTPEKSVKCWEREGEMSVERSD